MDNLDRGVAGAHDLRQKIPVGAPVAACDILLIAQGEALLSQGGLISQVVGGLGKNQRAVQIDHGQFILLQTIDRHRLRP